MALMPGMALHAPNALSEVPMQIYYVRVEDLHATKDTIDAPESEIREVRILDGTPGRVIVKRGGYATEEQE